MGVTARLIQPGETPETILESLLKRLGVPAVRVATRQAMRLLGSHFVLGQTIEEALERAGGHRESRYSFDMLGEGARTMADAERYRGAYAAAIDAIGAAAGEAGLPNRPGISVKLSALHPRFEAVSRARVLAELVPNVLELARKARDHDLNFTVDAEEADRLELTLDVIAAVLGDPSLRGWEGFGLAVQAYQKRAGAVIDWLDDTARALGRRLMVRLVKGAYWDTEVKRAQERGLADYPVFTRKADDRSLLYGLHAPAPAGAAPALSAVRHPQCAHRGERDRGCRRRRRLRVPAPARHGRGALRGAARRIAGRGGAGSMRRSAAIAICWPIWCGGCWRTAPTPPSSRSRPIRRCRSRPSSSGRRAGSRMRAHARHPNIPLPRDLYGPARLNSAGVEFGDRVALKALVDEVKREASGKNRPAAPPIEADSAVALAAMSGGDRLPRPGTRRRSSAAPTFSNAPAICWRTGARA